MNTDDKENSLENLEVIRKEEDNNVKREKFKNILKNYFYRIKISEKDILEIFKEEEEYEDEKEDEKTRKKSNFKYFLMIF